MTQKAGVINAKLNNELLFISMCVHEHNVGHARCDDQGNPGQAVLTASPVLQLASVAATDVTDVLCWPEDPCARPGP